MYVPCLNGKAADMIMSDAMKDMRRNKEDKQHNYNRALRLQHVYPHLKTIKLKFIMWALLRLGLQKVEETAALHLSPFTFKQHIQLLNQ